MSRLFRSSKSKQSEPPRQEQNARPQQTLYPQQQPRVPLRGNAGVTAAGGKQRPSAKNPQSGASYSSSSRGTQSSDDGAAVAINLTEQRLMDWQNDPGPPDTAAGATATAGKCVTFPNTNHHPQRKNVSPTSKGVSNLILLIEQSKWSAASQRAVSHPHEVKQLVKLRKTTKSSSGGASMGGVQISNVKCKALHHACQKLRSVHTNIYSNRMGGVDGEETLADGGGVIDQDEYIEACKCILALIRLHPEACKERESRHGCLPLHLAVFSMCATPPPPGCTEQGASEKAHSRISFDTMNTSSAQKPPVISTRSTSNPVKLPTQQGHRPSNSNSSTDFSLGNMSTMMQEENDHQQALDQHQQSVRASNEEKKSTGNTFEDKLLSRMDHMEMMLRDIENEYNGSKSKKKREKSVVSPTSVGMCAGDPNMPGGGMLSTIEGQTGATHTTTKVVGLSLPMDSLDELSRETDSHSTPLDELHAVEQNIHPVGKAPSNASSSSFTAQVGNLSKALSSKFTNAKSAAQTSNSTIASNTTDSSAQNYEELKRRYLQINTKRREEYSIRVINALIDAWPRGVKTSSEGGRLPLHMVCFGKGTVKVMEAILTSYPDAARQRNADGFLPIHIAAHWGVAHPDIAPMLLRAYPDGAVGRNRWERTPIEEALGMAGENGREHQMSLVWALRRHPTYWIHNDIATMLLPRNVSNAPWRLVDVGESTAGGLPTPANNMPRMSRTSGAVDVDEVGSSDDDEGFEVKVPQAAPYPSRIIDNPKHNLALAETTNLSILITKEKNWTAASIRCQRYPHEARESLEVKVRGHYTAKITPLHAACEQNPNVEVIRALINADPSALRRRQEPGGQLPLHAACTWGASADVIKVLLSASSDCAEACDFLSNLPLHCAVYSGAETAVVKALLRVYPQAVWPRNHQGSSAVDIARRLGHSNRREVVGLLEATMNELLTSKLAQGDSSKNSKAEEGVETNSDSGLMWV